MSPLRVSSSLLEDRAVAMSGGGTVQPVGVCVAFRVSRGRLLSGTGDWATRPASLCHQHTECFLLLSLPPTSGASPTSS